MLSRQSTCFCVVIVQCVCFLVCRCCCLCELNRRRRVRRFKRRLRLRLSCWAACVFARVFATFGGFILPLALAVAACAVVYVRARDSIYTQGGDRVLKVPRWGGCHLHVQFWYTLLVKLQLYRRGCLVIYLTIKAIIYKLVIGLSAYRATRAGIRGRGAAWREQKVP